MLESAARAAIDSHVGRALTDVERERARARLLEFARILRDWDRNAVARIEAMYVDKLDGRTFEILRHSNRESRRKKTRKWGQGKI